MSRKNIHKMLEAAGKTRNDLTDAELCDALSLHTIHEFNELYAAKQAVRVVLKKSGTISSSSLDCELAKLLLSCHKKCHGVGLPYGAC